MATTGEFAEYDPYEFEHFVASVWGAQGWQTDVRQQSNDAGIDIVAIRDAPVEETHIIQVKRYTEANKVGGPEIQQYAALRQQVPEADAVIVVTSTGFTKAAKQRSRELNVKLVDGEDLIQMAERTGVLDNEDEAADDPIPTDKEYGTLQGDDVESGGSVGSVFFLGIGVLLLALEFVVKNPEEVFVSLILSYVTLKFVDVLVFNVPMI